MSTFISRSFFFVFLLFTGFAIAQPKQALRSGWYRVSVQRTDEALLIFNVEMASKNGKQVMYIRNAEERLLVDELKQKGDSLFIEMPFFESSFQLHIEADHSLKGKWIKGTSAKNLELPVVFVYGEKERFPIHTKAKENISGRWKVDFTRPNGTDRPAIAEFEQKGSSLTGTFLTPSGDYRFLEGVVSGDSLYLSCFDGSHAYTFTAEVKQNEIVNGLFYSSGAAVEKWRAVKNEAASLPDTITRTQLKPGESKLSFSFPDVNGKNVSINDARFNNKVVVIQLMGSWCPNCMDESRFLTSFYQQYQSKGVEVIALAYEYSTDFSRSKASIQKFINRFGIKYPVLITPTTVNDELKTEKTLPQLTDIKFFPTTIFLDQQGNVRKVHSGFYGPGTGEHHQQFKSEFYRTIQSLLAE